MAHQIKRVLQWMLRIFFACTIGFAIPIQEFKSIIVIKKGFLYCLCMGGKTDKKQLKNKVKQIRKYLKQVLGNKSIIIIKRCDPSAKIHDLLFAQQL